MVAACVIPAGLAAVPAVPAAANPAVAFSAAGLGLPSSLQGRVDAAREELLAATREVDKAEAAVDKAQSQLSVAQAQLELARSKEAEAREQERQARERLANVERRVREQEERVAAAQDAVDDIVLKIATLARSSYISGAETSQLAILLESDDLAAFNATVVSMQRVSRTQGEIFETLRALEEQLRIELASLNQLRSQAEQEKSAASRHAEQAASQRLAAQSATNEIATLHANRQSQLQRARQLRSRQAATFRQLRERLAAASGVVTGTRTGRSPREAVNWAMQFVGSGAHYDGLCLGFVDDAYQPRGPRMPTAIAQWYRAKAAGVARSGDRNPPLGAHVFWWSPNAARHIALSIGGGMVITTGAYGGRVGIRSMSEMDSWGPYLGWAPAYYG